MKTPAVIPGRSQDDQTELPHCAPETLELPGSMLAHRPGMTTVLDDDRPHGGGGRDAEGSGGGGPMRGGGLRQTPALRPAISQ